MLAVIISQVELQQHSALDSSAPLTACVLVSGMCAKQRQQLGLQQDDHLLAESTAAVGAVADGDTQQLEQASTEDAMVPAAAPSGAAAAAAAAIGREDDDEEAAYKQEDR
jgi:type IV secretory pathway TrbL component